MQMATAQDLFSSTEKIRYKTVLLLYKLCLEPLPYLYKQNIQQHKMLLKILFETK